MSFPRSVLFLCLASLVAMFGLLAFGSAVGNNDYKSGYAVLTFNSGIEDSAVWELLDAGKDAFAGSPVSESLQWVLLDEFDSLNIIPLDIYSQRVFSFDPRNDGYAQKLKDVFIHNDERFIYVPLESGNWAQALLDKQFGDLLGDIPFSADYFGLSRPITLFFLAFCAASAALLIICYAKKKFQPGIISIIALLPVLFSLALFGAPGIAAAALLTGFAVVLREPLSELVLLFKNHKNSVQRKKIFRKNIVEPYSMHLFLLPVFAAALGVLVYFSELNLFFILTIFIVICALFFFSVKTLSLIGGNHRRFTPVLINRRQSVDFTFSLYMLPFAIAAVTVMFLSPNMSGTFISGGKLDHINIINEEDYYAHLIYQSSFSVQQMGVSSASYPSYIFDKDGLPAPDIGHILDTVVNIDDYPPFPLKHLMEFIDSVKNSGLVNRIGYNNHGITGYIPLLILLFFILPGLILDLLINERINFMPKDQFAGLKRSSGVLYGTEINWRKSLLYAAPGQNNIHTESSYSYKNKKSSRIQRDA